MNKISSVAPIVILMMFFLIPKTALASHQRTIPITITDGKTAEVKIINLPMNNDTGGATLAVADLGDDGVAELIVGNGYDNEPRVRILRQDGTEVNSFLAYAPNMGAGITVTACNLDDDAGAEIITGTQNGAGPHVRVWHWDNEMWSLKDEFFAFDASLRQGVDVSCDGPYEDGKMKIKTMLGPDISNTTTDENGRLNQTIFFDLNADGTAETIRVPGNHLRSKNATGKNIVVDISDQRLFAYENGLLARSFFVSTGVYNFPTPLGQFSVLEKVPTVNYSWSYGANNPNNYNLGNIPYNLRFKPHFYIHYAPWHNNFGHRMSHGCVNVNLENIKWIYNWADAGNPVLIKN